MQELVSFFQGIFLGKNNDKMKIGLSQFKKDDIQKKENTKKVVKHQKEIKLSDLMRRSA